MNKIITIQVPYLYNSVAVVDNKYRIFSNTACYTFTPIVQTHSNYASCHRVLRPLTILNNTTNAISEYVSYAHLIDADGILLKKNGTYYIRLVGGIDAIDRYPLAMYPKTPVHTDSNSIRKYFTTKHNLLHMRDCSFYPLTDGIANIDVHPTSYHKGEPLSERMYEANTLNVPALDDRYKNSPRRTFAHQVNYSRRNGRDVLVGYSHLNPEQKNSVFDFFRQCEETVNE
jgi:hypothetical protein